MKLRNVHFGGNLKLLQYFIKKCFLILNVQGYNSEQFFLSKHELLWQKKIEIHIECHPLRKIKVVFKATTPISDLVTWSIMPSLPSSMWENRAIHIFKRIFFKVYHQVFIFCIYIQPHFALPVISAGITQCFYSWWLLDCTV